MTDFASLAIEMDTRQVKQAASDLDQFTAAGARAEGAAQQTGRGWLQASDAISAARTQATGLGAGLDMQARSAASVITAGRKVTASAGEQRVGMQQLSYQIGDVAQQFALGVNPMIIFAQQGQQVIQAITLMRGSAGGLIGFLGGPWGAVIMGAAAIAGVFASKMFDAGEEAKVAGDKFETAADQAKKLAGAMNALALNKAKMRLNDLTSEQFQLEGQIGKYDQRKQAGTLDIATRVRTGNARERLQANAWEQVELRNTISLAESMNAALDKEEKTVRRTTAAHGERRTAMSEANRAYEQAVRSTDRYIESLTLEIEKIGKTPAQIRQIEIARAKEGAATEAQRIAIEKLNVARERALGIERLSAGHQASLDWDRTVLAPLQQELELVGLTGTARKVAALQMEEEAFKANLLKQGIEDVNARWQRYYEIKMGIIQAEDGVDHELKRVEEVKNALRELESMKDNFSFGSVFGEFGDGIDRMIDSINRLREAQEAYNAVKEKGTDAEVQKAGIAYTEARTNATLGLIGASKQFFDQQSTGYKVLSAIEKVYAAIKLANMIKAMVMDTTHTTTSVANSMTRATADQAAGASKMFSFLGPFAFPVVAAMIALLAGLGVKGGSGKSANAPLTAEQMQAQQGTGTVLGDPSAKSASIANSLQIMADNTNKQLEYSNAMVTSLRKIERGITALASALARQLSLSGGAFDTSGFRLGSSGSGGFLGLFASSTTRTLYDQGIQIFSTSLANALANGISGQTYSIVEQVKKKSGFLGIGGGTKTTYETYTNALDSEVSRQIQLILGDLKNTTVEAAKIIGFDVSKILDNFQVEIGKVSLQGLKGSEITDALSAVFSKVADQMAGFAVSGLEQFQKVGEGLFETLSRLAKDYTTVDVSLQSIGRAFGSVGSASIAAREYLLGFFESLDDFTSQTEFYRSNFLTEQEQIAPVFDAVSKALGDLGLSALDTIDEFKAVVNSLDLTTAAGASMYASLMAIAPAFAAVEKYQDKASKAYSDRADSLNKYLTELVSGSAASGYAAILSKFRTTSAAAALGDATALDELKGASSAYLNAVKDRAGSLLEYQRARAAVINSVRDGANAAENQADLLKKQVEVAQTTLATIQQAANDTTELQQQLAASLSALNAKLANVTDGDALKVTSSADTAFTVDVAA